MRLLKTIINFSGKLKSGTFEKHYRVLKNFLCKTNYLYGLRSPKTQNVCHKRLLTMCRHVTCGMFFRNENYQKLGTGNPIGKREINPTNFLCNVYVMITIEKRVYLRWSTTYIVNPCA